MAAEQAEPEGVLVMGPTKERPSLLPRLGCGIPDPLPLVLQIQLWTAYTQVSAGVPHLYAYAPGHKLDSLLETP